METSMQTFKEIIQSRFLAKTTSIVAGLLRLIPHPANFSSVGGLSIYGGARLKGASAFLLPLAIMAITDILLYFIKGYSPLRGETPFVYGALLINVLLGKKFLSNTESPLAIGSVTFAGSVQFFLVTNFGLWLTGGLYTMDMAGLTTCFIAAIPFFGATLAGDLVFSGLLFTAHHFLARQAFPAEAVSV